MKKFRILISIIVALAALMAGVAISRHYFVSSASTTAITGTVFSPPQAITAFNLIDSKGRPFNNASLQGHWSWLFFGFTQCTQICPPAMNNLNKMYQLLLKQQQKPIPQIIFISVDPAHDSLEKIAAYVTGFNPHFQGVTGDKVQLDKLAANLNVVYLTTKNTKTQEDTIDHSGTLLLINPQGQLAAIFSQPQTPTTLVQDFRTIVAMNNVSHR